MQEEAAQAQASLRTQLSGAQQHASTAQAAFAQAGKHAVILLGQVDRLQMQVGAPSISCVPILERGRAHA